MSHANTNNAQATEAEVAAMVAIPPIELDAKHGDLFGQIIFGTAKRALGGEIGAQLHKAYAERTCLDKVTYYTDSGAQAVKEAATDAYDIVKDIVVDSYESVKDWVTGDGKEKASKKAADAAESAANNQARVNRERFNTHFEQIEKTLEYNAKWENGTGYFNNLVTDKDLQSTLEIGALARCTDAHGRKMIIMQTGLGLLVIFARHNDENTSFRVNADKDLIKEVVGFKEECTDAVVTAKGFDIIFGEADTETLAQRLMKA
jgi:hypothetical protein